MVLRQLSTEGTGGTYMLFTDAKGGNFFKPGVPACGRRAWFTFVRECMHVCVCVCMRVCTP